jgi:hypothetical protein
VKYLLVGLLAGAALAASGKRTFTGVITDEMCPTSHASMRMGPTDAECAIACVQAHGAAYVLYDGHEVFALSDQQAPGKFAGRRVRVIGVLDSKTKTIQVSSISAAK